MIITNKTINTIPESIFSVSNYAYSLDGLKWVKKYKSIFLIPKKIKIISEPFVILIKNIIYIFFEYKDKDNKWNIAYKKVSKNKII